MNKKKKRRAKRKSYNEGRRSQGNRQKTDKYVDFAPLSPDDFEIRIEKIEPGDKNTLNIFFKSMKQYKRTLSRLSIG